METIQHATPAGVPRKSLRKKQGITAWHCRTAGIFALASLLALAIWRRDWVANWIEWLAALPHSNAFHPDNAWALALFSGLPSLSFLIISLSACLLLASLVFYFVFTEE